MILPLKLNIVQAKSTSSELNELKELLVQTSDTNDSVDVATDRKELLIKTIEQNSDTFFQHVLNSQETSALPRKLTDLGLVEQEKVFSGKLKLVIADYFEQKTSSEELFIGNYVIKSNNPRLKQHINSKIRIKGYVLDNYVIIDSDQLIEDSTVSISSETNIRDKQVLVVQVKFNNSTSVTDQDFLLRSFFQQNDSVSAYFEEVSFGKVKLTGRTYGPVEIPHPNDDCSDPYYYDTWATEIDELINNQGEISIDNYDYVAYSIPDSPCGRPNGQGELWGKRSWYYNSWGNNLHNFKHEIGHNMGAHHANILECTGDTKPTLSSCDSFGYSDDTDDMGFSEGHQFNGPHKYHVGWIGEEEVQNVWSDEVGSYRFTIIPSESSEPGTKLIRIHHNIQENNNAYYYLSYRQNIGVDASLPSLVTQGTLIHILEYSGFSHWIDTTPDPITDATGHHDGLIFDGDEYGGLSSNISIKQLSHNANGAEIEIIISEQDSSQAIKNWQQNWAKGSMRFDYNNDNVVNILDYLYLLKGILLN